MSQPSNFSYLSGHSVDSHQQVDIQPTSTLGKRKRLEEGNQRKRLASNQKLEALRRPNSASPHQSSTSAVAQPTALIQQNISRHQQLQRQIADVNLQQEMLLKSYRSNQQSLDELEIQLESANKEEGVSSPFLFKATKLKEQQVTLIKWCQHNQDLLDKLKGQLATIDEKLQSSLLLYWQNLKEEQTQALQRPRDQEQIKRIQQKTDDAFIWMLGIYQRVNPPLYQMLGVAPNEKSWKKIDEKFVEKYQFVVNKLEEETKKSLPNKMYIEKYEHFIDSLMRNFHKLKEQKNYSVILNKAFY